MSKNVAFTPRWAELVRLINIYGMSTKAADEAKSAKDYEAIKKELVRIEKQLKKEASNVDSGRKEPANSAKVTGDHGAD